MRFDPEFLMAKQLYDDGDLGRVFLADAHYVHDMRSVYPLTPWRLHAPQDLMYGGVTHPIDLLRWFLGDVAEVHALGGRGDLVPEYPQQANFVLNLRFTSGAIGRVLGAFDLVEPPLPMMGLGLYGTRASLSAAYTDRAPGRVRLVLDKVATHPTSVTDFPARVEGSYGHGDAVRRYMAHLHDCLVHDRTPSPGVRDGAASVAIAAAAWESVRTGQTVAVAAIP
jgi:predicted dehydrogenase